MTDPATASHCSPKGNEDQPQATSPRPYSNAHHLIECKRPFSCISSGHVSRENHPHGKSPQKPLAKRTELPQQQCVQSAVRG